MFCLLVGVELFSDLQQVQRFGIKKSVVTFSDNFPPLSRHVHTFNPSTYQVRNAR